MAEKRKSHDELRTAALDEAGQILDAEGLGALGARRIAAATGCSVGTLYNVFGDLDGLIAALNIATLRGLRVALSAAIECAPDSIEDRLSALADSYLDFALAHPKRWDALFRFRRGDEVGSEALAETGQMFAMLESEASGLADREALTALWAAVHGVVELALHRHLTDSADGSERRYLRLIVETALKGFAVK